jgi:N-acetylglucosaminyldiphosphoundecaprenol N-acetyl-beta-D-mannosaminyltransferase
MTGPSGSALVWGLPLAPWTRERAADAVMELIEAARPSFFITANVHYAMLTAERPELRAVNDRAAFVLADGAPLVWASRRGPTPLPERVAGSDLIYDLCDRAARLDRGVYLLGGAEGVADEAARRLVALYPGLRIVGTACPSPGSLAGAGVGAVIGAIRAARPDLLMVALGQPKGELWLAEHLDELGVPVSVQVGATLDFVAGRVKRAPKLVQKVGMEWAFRITTDPVRLAPRYAQNALFLFGQIARDLVRKAPPPPSPSPKPKLEPEPEPDRGPSRVGSGV